MTATPTSTNVFGAQSSGVQGFSAGVSELSTAASDLFAGLYTAPAEAAAATAQEDTAEATAQADILQGQGAAIEGEAYGEAATLAQLNAQYSTASTNIQVAQSNRSNYMNIGTDMAAAGASGSSGGGSAGDILRNTAQQGALNTAVIQQQGLITTAGYNEQAESYELMQQAAGVTQQADVASAQGETEAASEYATEANLFQESATGDFIGAAINGLASIGSFASI
jgi:hypothetical protein